MDAVFDYRRNGGLDGKVRRFLHEEYIDRRRQIIHVGDFMADRCNESFDVRRSIYTCLYIAIESEVEIDQHGSSVPLFFRHRIGFFADDDCFVIEVIERIQFLVWNHIHASCNTCMGRDLSRFTYMFGQERFQRITCFFYYFFSGFCIECCRGFLKNGCHVF